MFNRYLFWAAKDIASIQQYDDFASTVNIAVGSDPSVQKVAMFFKIVSDVIMSAASEESRTMVLSWTDTFYRDNLAPWVAENNGLVCAQRTQFKSRAHS